MAIDMHILAYTITRKYSIKNTKTTNKQTKCVRETWFEGKCGPRYTLSIHIIHVNNE